MNRWLKWGGLVLLGGFAVLVAYGIQAEEERRRRKRIAELNAAERDADGGCLPPAECAECRGDCPPCREEEKSLREKLGDPW